MGKHPSKPTGKTSLTLLISRKVGHESPTLVLALCFLKQGTVCAMDPRLATLRLTAGELVVNFMIFQHLYLKV